MTDVPYPLALPVLLAAGVVAFVLGLLGERINRVVFPEYTTIPKWSIVTGWRRAWVRTVPIHPVIGGALFGFAGELPVPEPLSGFVGRVLWWTVIGGLSHVVFRKIQERVNQHGKTSV